MLATPCTYGEQKPDRVAPLQGRTPNRWFAVVVGCRNVEPRSLSMTGIDTLAHTHTDTHTHTHTHTQTHAHTHTHTHLSTGFWTGAACAICDRGYFGPDCTSACPGGAAAPCHGHGRCLDGPLGSGVCHCDDGFGGPDCALQCPGVCHAPPHTRSQGMRACAVWVSGLPFTPQRFVFHGGPSVGTPLSTLAVTSQPPRSTTNRE